MQLFERIALPPFTQTKGFPKSPIISTHQTASHRLSQTAGYSEGEASDYKILSNATQFFLYIKHLSTNYQIYEETLKNEVIFRML